MSTPRSSTKRGQPATNADAPRRRPKQARSEHVDLTALGIEEVKKLGSELVNSISNGDDRGVARKLEKGLYFVTRSKVFNAAQIKQQEIAEELYSTEHKKNEAIAKATIQNMTLASVQWNDMEKLAEFDSSLHERISQDPILHGNFHRNFGPQMDKGLMEFCAAKLAHIFAKHSKEEAAANRPKGKTGKRRGKKRNNSAVAQVPAVDVDEVPEPVRELTPALIELIQRLTYQCPETRTLLTRPGGMMGNNEIAVYCDLSSAEREKTGYHNALIFDYIDRTYLDEKKYPDLTAIKEKAEKKENLISCKCCSEGSTVKCWENPDCDCYKTNVELQKLQTKNHDGYPFKAQFNSFEPTIFGGNPDFESTAGFACSELCSCKGNCTNNATLIADKKIFPLELFRENAIIGFALRSLAAIPAGTLFVEYTGELVEGALMADVDQDYAFALLLSSQANTEIFTGAGDWTQKFRGELKSQLLCNWSIDSKRMGNVARFISHSCFPNCAFIRVFKKGFSPAHCRIFLITLMDIFPGVELTIDYGSTYVEQNFKGGCLCKSFACKNNPEVFKAFSELSGDAIKSFFALSHYSEFHRYTQIVESSE